MKTRIILIICLITGIAVHLSANEKIYINREVTTHIVMPENIKMIDISTEGILFWEEVEKHRLKKLVTCDWEVLPMTGHQFFMAHVTQREPLGRAAP